MILLLDGLCCHFKGPAKKKMALKTKLKREYKKKKEKTKKIRERG
jgi:hypothetical protein